MSGETRPRAEGGAVGESQRSKPAWVRHDTIRQLVSGGRFQRTLDLADRFGVSVVTIRSDLEELEATGALVRVRGGAVGPGDHRELSFERAQLDAADAKERIAVVCAGLVESGQSIFLDAGTTTAAIAGALARRDDLEGVTVITNNLVAVMELRTSSNVTLIVTGGTFRLEQHSLVDPLGWPLLERVRADVAFIGSTGLSAAGGVTNVNLPEAEMKLRMLSAAGRHVFPADLRKLGQVSTAFVGALKEGDTVVTDAPEAHVEVAALRDVGVNVLLV